MKTIIVASIFVLLAVLAGCDPPELLFWSPDGRHAAVLAPDGVHVCDGDGKLSGPLIEGARSFAWFSDSTQALVVKLVAVKSWKDAEPYLDEADAKSLATAAEVLLAELKAYPGDVQKFFEEKLKDSGANEPIATAQLIYLRDKRAQELKARIGDADWAKIADVSAELYCLQRYEIADSQAKPQMILAAIFAPIAEIRISSRESAIAYVTAASNDGNLYLVPSAGGRSIQIADHVSRYPDWTRDGRSIVYIRATGAAGKNDLPRLASLRRMEVLDIDGSLKKDVAFDAPHKRVGPDGTTTDVPSDAQNLAMCVFDVGGKVRCLPDGRTIFSDADVSLPAAAEAKHNTSLFAVGADLAVGPLLPAERMAALPDAVHYFQLSPDGHHIAVPGTAGQVAVIDVSNGQITEVNAKSEGHKLRMMPTWRGNDQLCFAIQNPPEAAKDRPAEVYLATIGQKPRCISKSWPKEVIAVLRLDDNPNQAQPQN